MNAVSWGSTCLTVQIETLDKHRVVAKATHPNIPLPPTLQLNSTTNVKPAGKQHAEEESQRRDKEEDSWRRCMKLPAATSSTCYWSNWLPGTVAGRGAVDIAQLSQTETVSS